VAFERSDCGGPIFWRDGPTIKFGEGGTHLIACKTFCHRQQRSGRPAATTTPRRCRWLRDRAATDHHQDVRRAAITASAAGWHDDPDTLPLLRDRATTDNDEDVRQTAVDAIASYGDRTLPPT
jgi:hypothetical protein